MQDWTVINSSEFKQNLAGCFADFRARLAAHNAAPKGKSAKQLQRSIAGFNHFVRKLRKLSDTKDRAVLPEKELAYVQDDSEGTPIYSLIDGNWRCLFRVDTQEKTCTAVSIELMIDNLRFVEQDRHKHGKKLNDVDSL